jgi:hypothetical protein
MSLLASNCNRLSLCFVWFLMGVLHCKPDHGLLLMRLVPGLALELKKAAGDWSPVGCGVVGRNVVDPEFCRTPPAWTATQVSKWLASIFKLYMIIHLN